MTPPLAGRPLELDSLRLDGKGLCLQFECELLGACLQAIIELRPTRRVEHAPDHLPDEPVNRGSTVSFRANLQHLMVTMRQSKHGGNSLHGGNHAFTVKTRQDFSLKGGGATGGPRTAQINDNTTARANVTPYEWLPNWGDPCTPAPKIKRNSRRMRLIS